MTGRREVSALEKPKGETVDTSPSARQLRQAAVASMRAAIATMKQEKENNSPTITKKQTWSIPKPPPGVIPRGSQMAMDSAIQGYSDWAIQSSIFAEGQTFLGYPYLAELSQRPEYRVISETWAEEMTRNWIRLVSTGSTDMHDKTEKLKELEVELKRLKVQELFRKALELDGYFGRSHIYIDLGDDFSARDELKTTIGSGSNAITKSKISKGSVRGLKIIEAIWTYPNVYNANNPLADDFFKPSTWFVMGTEIHTTRMLTFIGRPMPDLLKPMYSFGGLSLSQMAKPYVDNWLRTRQSVSDAISNFSIMMLLTDMSTMLTEGAMVDLMTRVDYFNTVRDNRGLMLGDKNTEDMKNVAMPLSGLHELQAQSQEHMSSVSQIPLVKLTGISPSGLNASSKEEMDVFYNKIEARQEAECSDQLMKVIQIAQLNLWGEIDPEIGFEWEPLAALTETELATVRKIEAETDTVLIDHGVILPEESRTRIAADKSGPYSSLDLNKEISVPGQELDMPGAETDDWGRTMEDPMFGIPPTYEE